MDVRLRPADTSRTRRTTLALKYSPKNQSLGVGTPRAIKISIHSLEMVDDSRYVRARCCRCPVPSAKDQARRHVERGRRAGGAGRGVAGVSVARQLAVGERFAAAHRGGDARHAGARRGRQRPRGGRREPDAVRARGRHRHAQGQRRRHRQEGRRARRDRIARPERPAEARAVDLRADGGRGGAPAHPRARSRSCSRSATPTRRRSSACRRSAPTSASRRRASPAWSPRTTS